MYYSTSENAGAASAGLSRFPLGDVVASLPWLLCLEIAVTPDCVLCILLGLLHQR